MGIPTHYIKKRDLLHSEKTSVEVLSRTGKEFLALERYSDALDFFEKARDIEAIKQIKKIALDSGDTFLLARLDRFDRNLLERFTQKFFGFFGSIFAQNLHHGVGDVVPVLIHERDLTPRFQTGIDTQDNFGTIRRRQ